MASPTSVAFNGATGSHILGGRTAAPGAVNIMALRPTPGVLKSVHMNALSSVNACATGNNCWFSETAGQDGPWTLWAGAVLATGYSTYGAAVYEGGGHGGYDGPEAYVFDVTTCQWVRKGNVPATSFLAQLDPAWCDFPFEGGHLPPATHVYGNCVYIAPAFAGNTKGAFVLTSLNYADTANNINGGNKPHVLDLDTGVWNRFTTAVQASTGNGYGCSFIDTTRNIVWGVTGNDSNSHYKVDLSAPPGARAGVVVSSFYSPGWYSTTRYIASKDMVIGLWCDFGSTLVKMKRYDMTTGTPVELATATFSAPLNVPSTGFGWDYCPDTGKFYLYDGMGATTLNVLTPPIDWKSGGVWTWSTEIMSGETPVSIIERYGTSQGGDLPLTKWLYNPAIKCFMWSQGKTSRLSPDGVMRDGAFQLYRPLGT